MFLQAVLETVAKITHEKGKKNDTQVAKYGSCKIFLGANNCIFTIYFEIWFHLPCFLYKSEILISYISSCPLCFQWN